MARKSKKTLIVAEDLVQFSPESEAPAPISVPYTVEADKAEEAGLPEPFPTEAEQEEVKDSSDFDEAQAEAEIEDQIALPRSVVKPQYKVKYRDRARSRGDRGKAAKRSNWDWLAQEIAAFTLTEKAKLRVTDLLDLLEANGIDHSRWQNRSPGWEGRLRMTGRLALQRVVAESGILRFPDGEWKEAPGEWAVKYRA